MTLWHGRFAEGPADELLAFTESLSFDRRLAPDDLAGSRAHVRMLAAWGCSPTTRARRARRARPRRGRARPTARSSSRRPTKTSTPRSSAGSPSSPAPAGAKLHTGRSRNDQVATDLRLFFRREGTDAPLHVHRLQEVLRRRCRATADDAYLPGYTHLQRAQPVLLAHHFLAHFWAFARDVERWRDALDARRRVAARRRRARGLEPPARSRRGRAPTSASPRRFDNSLDAVSDRDFVAEALFVAALTQVHLSRLGEEIVLWSSDEFGFLRLADAYSTGSSMLPQKKNPDIAELARGKAGPPHRRPHRVPRHAQGPAARLQPRPPGGQGAPLRRARPVPARAQRDRRAARHLRASMPTGCGAPPTQPDVAAVDLAEWLVGRGVPFREAHARVGALVRQSQERGVPARRARDDATPTSVPRRCAAAGAGRRGAAPHHPGRRGPRVRWRSSW